MTHDAIVVGAGPAGSAAAIMLARSGRRVRLLARRRFPRDKPCGDLIGARALAAAWRLGVHPAELNPYRRIEGAAISAEGGRLDLVPGSALGRRLLRGTDARVVPRAVFDHLLVQSAERAGAELCQATVRDIGPWRRGARLVRVETSLGADELAARAVIVAGGYGCRVSAELAPRSRQDGPARGIAMRGYFRGVACPVNRIVFALDRWLLPGYGWVFPLPDGGANVGVGTLLAAEGQPERLAALFDRFVGDPASPAAAMLRDAVPAGRPRSWPLDLGPRRRRLVADGLVVAGEAAGLVGPLTGAGIAFALESGERAGRTVAAALASGDLTRHGLRAYAATTRRMTAPWLRGELLAQRVLADPGRVERIVGIMRPLPPTATLGARLLLHLG